MKLPDHNGHFGKFGGRFIPEIFIPELLRIKSTYDRLKKDESFNKEFNKYCAEYAGRQTPLYFAKHFSEYLKGAKVYFKREDILANSLLSAVLGQALVAKALGKRRLIADVDSGEQGVAVSAVAALFGLECRIFMQEKNILKQKTSVDRIRLQSADIIPVFTDEQNTPRQSAFTYWRDNLEDSIYIAARPEGPAPYPEMVRDFNLAVGYEVYQQISECEKHLPQLIIGGSHEGHTLSLMYPFIRYADVGLIAVEARPILTNGRLGVQHGANTYVYKEPEPVIALGANIQSVAPELAFWKDNNRIKPSLVHSAEVVKAVKLVMQTEGIFPSLENGYALAEVIRRAPGLTRDAIIVVAVSGSGEKDLDIINSYKDK